MVNPYVDLCLKVQAARRRFEAIRSPLVPAIGVAASLYTHQLANVQRVLTDVRVRHLLADEVGLGKTVQALMILNALRIQRADLQALIMVPDELVAQWRDEIMTRAHTAPFGDGDGMKEGQYIRLAWEGQLRMTDNEGNPRLTLSDIDPNHFDVLIVDELHRLRTDVQDRIVQVAATFDHILLLTASPAFQKTERHAQLFALLEPERTALARWQIATGDRGIAGGLGVRDDLSQWPEWASSAVVQALVESEHAAASSLNEEALSAGALTHCAYRRIIRTRRVDYAGVLPLRKHRPLVVQPLSAEAARQSLMWTYFQHLSELTRRFDPVLLAKRAILSPPSLEQRVDFLRRKGHERAGLLEKVKPLVHRSRGDSRADGLVDLLMEIWAENPTERVLVAAQDNLTVDYLFDLVQARLPLVGPLSQRKQLVAARVRQGMKTEAIEDIGGFGNETNENLEMFQRGEAQVLFAAESAQVGLNLQCARVLVLYSVPWRPQEIEQWIGRLDRIGNTAAFSNDGEGKAIDVYTIAQHGLVDEKVVSVLQRFHVFERGVNLDGDHLEEVSSLIEDAALYSGRITWRELEKTTEEMAAEDEVKELDSPLRRHLPWSVKWARTERDRLDSMPPAPPVLNPLPTHSALGPRAWDRALEGFLKLLNRAGDYHIRWNTDPTTGIRFRTLWYKFGDREATYGDMFSRLNHQRQADRREVAARVEFSFDEDPGRDGTSRSPKNAHAYITRRGDIGTWPRLSVTLELSEHHVRRPLRFLNFGDMLHDELIQGWLPQGHDLAMLDVQFSDDHDIWKLAPPGLYVFRLLIIDPAVALLGNSLKEQVMETLTLAAEHSDLRRIPGLIQPFKKAAQCALESDIRWLRSQLTATMMLDLRRLDEDGNWVKATADAAAAMMNPMAHDGKGVPMACDIEANDKYIAAIESHLSRLRLSAAMTSRSEWSHRFPAFEDSLSARLLVVREEGHESIALASKELWLAETRLQIARERENRAQTSRARNFRDAAMDTLEMTRIFWSERENWLHQCQEKVSEILPREQISAFIRARKIRQ